MCVRATTGRHFCLLRELDVQNSTSEQEIDGDEREFLLSPFNIDEVRSHLFRLREMTPNMLKSSGIRLDEEERRRCHYDQERNNKKEEMNYDQ